MDFVDKIKHFSKRVEELKDNIQTEEATKTSLILPFFTMLGYDVFNPYEFVPEFVADVGTKKGEKVDYAVFENGKPTIIIEAKSCGSELSNKHINQLFRYFTVVKARFGVLTNGIVYKFYSDLEEQNKMDLIPFLEVDLLNLNDKSINELKRFCKSEFDAKNILTNAAELKYSAMIKKALSEQINEPSDQFVKALIKDVYSGTKTQAVINKFRDIIKDSFNEYINDILNEKLQTIISEPLDFQRSEQTIKKERVLEKEEIEILDFVKNILSDEFKEIVYKKTDRYVALQIGENSRKWVCRVSLRQTEHLFVLHKFGDYENEYTFTDSKQLLQIKDLIINVARLCLKE